jgi:hypothetical protein
VESKRGNGGWTVYELNSETYTQVLTEQYRNSSVTFKKQFRNNSVSGSVTESVTNDPSKLVSNINNNLLTNESKITKEEYLAETLNVAAVNIDTLTSFHIFRKQIQDIKNQNLAFTTESLQDFVDRFAIYASDSKNIKNVKSIPAVFVKMAQLASKGQDPLADIETDTDRLIRERIERLKTKRDERLNQENELFELEFEDWSICLSNDQIEKIVPTSAVMKSGSPTQKIMLKNYFKDTIWPAKKDILYSTTSVSIQDQNTESF